MIIATQIICDKQEPTGKKPCCSFDNREQKPLARSTSSSSALAAAKRMAVALGWKEVFRAGRSRMWICPACQDQD